MQKSTKNIRTDFTRYNTTKIVFIRLRLKFVESNIRPTTREILIDGRHYINIKGKDRKYLQKLAIDKLVEIYFSKQFRSGKKH